MGLNKNGFDDLSKRLNQMANAAQELDGENQIPMDDLLNNDFISANTKFNTAQELYDSSGFDFSTQQSFEDIPESQLDIFINDNTDFESWHDLISSAAQEYVLRKIGF